MKNVLAMKNILFVFCVFIYLISCKENNINEELKIPTEIDIYTIPIFTGVESIEGKMIDKNINWQLPPITSLTEIVGGFSMYAQGAPLFIMRKDTIMFVIGYKGERLLTNQGANITISCKDDESKKIIDMITFLKSGYPSNFWFQIWQNGEIIKTTQQNYSKNSLVLKAYSLHKIVKDTKIIPVVLLKLKLKVFDANDKNVFDGIFNFCYVPRGKTCE